VKYILLVAVLIFAGCVEITETLKQQVDQGVKIGNEIYEKNPNSQLAKDNLTVHVSVQRTVGKPEKDIPYTPEAVAENAEELKEEAEDRGWFLSIFSGVAGLASNIPGWGWLGTIVVGGIEWWRRNRKSVRLVRGIIESVNMVKARAKAEGQLNLDEITAALGGRQEAAGIRDEVKLILKTVN